MISVNSYDFVFLPILWSISFISTGKEPNHDEGLLPNNCTNLLFFNNVFISHIRTSLREDVVSLWHVIETNKARTTDFRERVSNQIRFGTKFDMVRPKFGVWSFRNAPLRGAHANRRTQIIYKLGSTSVQQMSFLGRRSFVPYRDLSRNDAFCRDRLQKHDGWLDVIGHDWTYFRINWRDNIKETILENHFFYLKFQPQRYRGGTET